VRVTFNQSYADAANEVNLVSARLAEAERQVSSGRRIDAPSDDPAGASAVITDRGALSQLDAYTQTADAATSRLTVIDTTLSDIVDKITAAQSAALSARGSEKTQSERDAAAADLQGIVDALLSDFNAQFHGVYLFSGSASTTSPYVKTAGVISSYQGNAATAAVDVGTSRSTQVTFDGGQISQGSDSADVFVVLANLISSVKSGDNAGIGQGLDALGRAFDRATSAQTQAGTGLKALDDARAQLSRLRLDTSTQISKLEDVNMASAITQMTEADTSYRAALAALGKIASVSLMDYLK
jgi:flagellar hook-associated protein 3 FlgL